MRARGRSPADVLHTDDCDQRSPRNISRDQTLPWEASLWATLPSPDQDGLSALLPAKGQRGQPGDVNERPGRSAGARAEPELLALQGRPSHRSVYPAGPRAASSSDFPRELRNPGFYVKFLFSNVIDDFKTILNCACP